MSSLRIPGKHTGVRSPTVRTFAFAPSFAVLQLGRVDGEFECPWHRMGDMPAGSCYVETQTNFITRPSPGLGRSSAEIANVAPFLRDFHLIPCPEVTAFRPQRPRGQESTEHGARSTHPPTHILHPSIHPPPFRLGRDRPPTGLGLRGFLSMFFSISLQRHHMDSTSNFNLP
ncbi:uncharacterized protein LY79DRAFT_141390 [Colletotrichum navitas]|uniref:Uncharacterized protein n=1 Tax=Colletotrichum navitas TaxID=681940 RepID=A0AAD8VBU9_9PEZI|nr:uncharacterized protein LY79DRAFT_141390 [Colletotrichum navitas]KAK1599448.1 hypothetical protein LY79DRAFT_141390 [Colletotrichum navitas]